MNVIRAEHISKSYLMGEIEVKALQEASFTIKEGEFVVILGPSGSGKSTLLNIIGGMDQPTTGKVFLYDEEITGYSERQLTQYRRDKVGFVFQFYNIMANLTAEENIELATEISRKPLPVEQVLEAVGLDERKDHFPAQMSGGEQQRVSIARAVAKNPDILLCDEPTGALDYNTGITILALLRKVNREMGKTVIVITHNSDIAYMADRVIKMRSGRIIDDRVNENPMAVEEIKW
ncbi:ABC transporter ATP-binding protein [Anoxybacterium hadale]|uniref:ABC transporter ATP-binding protein n=1 Tax=Anoxybacterium hadale TaxID=3408580 RepID=A0ACD1AFN7_9FIRM|nr:ABC transporter ATP-binding protein [Clostridiales bacterium]